MSEAAIRPIRATDDAALAAIIRSVMPEFGADGDGFAITDPEVDTMHRAYTAPRAAYWVVDLEGRVAGGCGFAPLEGGPSTVCELRKMYFVLLRDTMFIFDPAKLAAVKASLRADGRTEDEIEASLYYRYSWWRERVPRHVLPPSALYPRVRAVFELCGNKTASTRRGARDLNSTI